MWRALLGLAALAGAKQDALQVFLGELQRKLSDEVSEAQHWQQQRHEWCQSTLSLLAQEGQRGEGVVEELRQSLAKWDAAPREDGRSSFVQLRQATELQELQERLRLRGASSSAQHRFTEALRRDCAAAFEQSEVRHKAVEEELELLQSSAEALQASEAGRAGALEPAGDLGHHWGGKIGGIWVLDLRRPSGDPPVTSVERRPFEFETTCR
ncbi:unnamed protein product [Durusdinium trenchii]|uniref:Inositol-pentakisphosphate 2-kinase n=1 Tax=Durusdinium trenchii TaxID=1381693 RepID=A0ABP0HND8_9DINO